MISETGGNFVDPTPPNKTIMFDFGQTQIAQNNSRNSHIEFLKLLCLEISETQPGFFFEKTFTAQSFRSVLSILENLEYGIGFLKNGLGIS